MRIVLTRLVALGLLLGVALTVACGGSSTPAGVGATSSTSSSVVGTQAASPTTTSSPVTSAAASPAEASPTGNTVSLAQALTNLSQQTSFVIKVTMTGVTGVAAVLPNAGPTLVVTTERNGDNSHVVVANADGTKLAQVWRVGSQQWVDMGSGPQPVTGSTPQLVALTPIVNAPSLLLGTFSGAVSQYTVTGHETVNGVQATVEKGTFQVNDAQQSILFPVASASVNSTIWVADQGGYLLRANLQLSGAAGTPTTGSSTPVGSPSVGGGNATVMADVTNVGSAPSIGTPTP